MGLHSPNTSHEFTEPAKEVLTKAQKAIVERVILILETNPELNKKVSKSFEKNFLDVVSDIGKFNLLLEKLGSIELAKLGSIETRFRANDLTQQEAITESTKIIEDYTRAKLSALKGHITGEVA